MTTIAQYQARAKRDRKGRLIEMEIIPEMKVIYKDSKLALLHHNGAYTPPMAQNVIGFRPMTMLHEVWVYNPINKRFLAEKNRGLGQELVQHMAQWGIKLKSSAARVSDAATMELRFASDRDYFLFKLKYSL